MIRNYFKIALRNLLRHKGYSLINILGLAIGIACCLVLYLVVNYETHYDTFQPNYNRIARVVTQNKYPDNTFYNPGVPFPMVDAMRVDFPELKTGSLFSAYGCQVTVINNGRASKKFIENSGVFFADPEFFDLFQYKWLSGNAKVLAEPNMVVLTKNMAVKYFGDWQTATGKYLMLDNVATVKVAAIIDNTSRHSDFPLQVIGSALTMKNNPQAYDYEYEWGSTTSNFQVYTLLPPNVTIAKIDAQLALLKTKYYGKDRKKNRTHFLQALSGVHFDTRFGNFGTHVTSKSKLMTLSLIGVLIIVMACINFINLSTAKAVTRSKEIGVRKVLGGSRKQLFWQMTGETAIVVVIATILALGITALAMPYIKNIMSIEEPLSLVRMDIAFVLLTGMILVTFISGIYPSMILSGFTPALALKNKITSATIGGISLRRGLVVTQFAISQVLIIGTIIAVSQMNFVSKADLGFNKDAILVLNSNTDSTLQSRQKAFKQKLLQDPGIQSVSFSSDVPSSENNWGSNFAFDHKPDEEFTLYSKFADVDYFKTFGLKFLAGRSYNESDTINEVVVNQTLLNKLRVKTPNEAIGKQIRLGGRQAPWRTIVGVVQDFKTNSLREEVRPILISSRKKTYRVASIKLHLTNTTQAQKAIAATWDKFFPEYANTYFFMDQNIRDFYQQENQLSLVYKIFAGIAIFISCLGLYGLVSFMAVQRTKEVGIRKVLGASVGHIIYLFSKEFTLLILLAFVIAAPIAYYMMRDWLNGFVFRINIGLSVFVIAIITSVIIAWLTVGLKAVKAALANPVKSLRSE